MKRALIIDGNNLVMRGVAAMPAADKNSEDTDGIGAHIAMRSIHSILRRFPGTFSHVIAAFDCGICTERVKIYPDYKKARAARRVTRDPAETESIKRKMDAALDVFKAFGIQCIQLQGVEADDICGAMARKFAGSQSVVASGDKDLFQLANGDVVVFDVASNTVIDRTEIRSRFGVRARHFVLFKSLMGDPSDSIPGATGIGEKTAQMLVKTYEPLLTAKTAMGQYKQLRDAIRAKKTKGEKLTAKETSVLTSKEGVRTAIRLIDLSRYAVPELPEAVRPCPSLKGILRECKRYGLNHLATCATEYLSLISPSKQS